MPKVILTILIIGIVLISCKTENEKLIGHWHEYGWESNGSDFSRCFIVTDSTFATEKFTIGGVFKYSDFENENFWIATYYPEELIANRVVNKNEVIFGDSIIWKRQKDDLKTFVSDFSAGIKLNIIPFETDKIDFEVTQPDRLKNFIFIGPVKSEFTDNSNGISKSEFYLQLNEKITTPDDIGNFIMCNHCEYDKIDFYINADRNVPKSYLERIETEMSKFGINLEEQVFYLYMNKNLLKTGYKRTTANNVYN